MAEEVVGFRNRYRQPGIGTPLAAATERIDPNEPVLSFVVGPHVRVPVTAFLRLPNPSDQSCANRSRHSWNSIPGVESELVVHYEHSMQSKPEVISEVQRILHRHLELNSCTAAPDECTQGATRRTVCRDPVNSREWKSVLQYAEGTLL